MFDEGLQILHIASPSTAYHLNTGINEILNPSNHIFIYPNPNDGSFTLHYNLPSGNSQLSILNSQFLIKDVTGREVYSTTISGTQGTQAIDVSTLVKGIYYWEVVSESGVSGIGKLAVMK